MNDDLALTRRQVLAAGGMTLAGAAGCLDGDEEDEKDPDKGLTDEKPSPSKSDRKKKDRPRAFHILEGEYDELEEERTNENFFLDGSVDDFVGGSAYAEMGVRATDDVLLASRGIQNQDIHFLEEDNETFRWYANEISRAEDGFSSLNSILRRNNAKEFKGEPLGGGALTQSFETYLEQVSNDLTPIAPFLRINSDTNQPIISDDVIEDFETKRKRLRKLKNDYRDLISGRNSLTDLVNHMHSKSYKEEAVSDAEGLYDDALTRYGGLMLLEEVYRQTESSLRYAQDLAKEGEFDEYGERKDPKDKDPNDDPKDDDNGENGDDGSDKDPENDEPKNDDPDEDDPKDDDDKEDPGYEKETYTIRGDYILKGSGEPDIVPDFHDSISSGERKQMYRGIIDRTGIDIDPYADSDEFMLYSWDEDLGHYTMTQLRLEFDQLEDQPKAEHSEKVKVVPYIGDQDGNALLPRSRHSNYVEDEDLVQKMGRELIDEGIKDL